MALSLKTLFNKVGASTSNQSGSVVGIDFGSSSIKVVELEPRENFVALKTYGELQLGPYAQQPLGSIVNLESEKRTEALVDVMRESGVTAKKGVLALPLSMSFVTTVQLQHMGDDAMDARVQVEARKYIPVPLKEVALEWTVLPSVQEQEDVDEVLIAAVENKAYQDMNILLTSVGLSSQPTEIELFCAQRAVSNAKNTYALLDMGASMTKVYLIHESVVHKIHRVFTGGQQVTHDLSKQLNVEIEESENIKRSGDLSEQQRTVMQTVYNQVYQRPLQEIRRVIQSFEQQNNVAVEHVILTGGVATSSQIQQQVHEVLDKPCEVINCFENVAYPAFMEDTLKDIAPSFSVALGAALRQVQ